MTKRSMRRSGAGGDVSAVIASARAAVARWSAGPGREWIPALILMTAVALAYAPVWWAGYIWDDDAHLTANPCIIGPLGFKEIWTTSAADISPLTRSTFWVEHALWGLAPLPYHLVNVLLHGACAVLLWRVLRGLSMPGAWLGAAVWALHPVEVESVAWITEMKNTESGLFYLLSVFFFLRWLRAKDAERAGHSGWSYGGALLFAALAMASKSSTVILPVVLCLCAWWMEGRWRWRNVARAAPFCVLSIAASALSIWTQGLQLVATGDSAEVRSWPWRLATAGDAIWFYLGKLLWPHPLITIYPGWQIDTGQASAYVPLLAAAGLMIILWLACNSWGRPFFFVFAYFVAALLPVLGLVDNPIFHYSPVFDHFQYLASMGPLALAGAGLARFFEFISLGKQWLRAAMSAGMLLILGLTSWQRAWVYQNEETLWSDTLAKNPGCWIGYNNLGHALLIRGEVDEAVADYRKMLEIRPRYAEGYSNLGYALLEKGGVDEAMAAYQKALEINPNFAEVHANLGNALGAKGRLDDAMAEYRKALEIDPTLADAHNNLGNAFLQKGRPDEAMAEYQKALAINPNLSQARTNLGNALMQEGRVDEAMAEYEKVLAIDPNFADVHNALGVVYAQKGWLDEAIAQFQEALRLKPGLSGARSNLAKAQAMQAPSIPAK